MRRALTPFLAGLVSVTTLLATTPALASVRGGAEPAGEEAAEDDATRTRAQELYREGEKAYRLGKFDVAVEKFEAAYDVYPLPNLLYNIGLANKRLYETSRDPAHLRKAQAVLKNFKIEVQKNPDLGSVSEIEELLSQIDKDLARVDEDERAREEAARKAEEERQKAALEALGEDPGKKMRTAGIVLLPTGAGLIIGGAVVLIVFGLRGKEFSSKLANVRAEMDELGCGGSTSGECGDLANDEQIYIDNGNTANILAGALGGTLGFLGLVGVVAGAVLLPLSSKKTQQWQKAHEVSLVPTLGGGATLGGGFALSGRF